MISLVEMMGGAVIDMSDDATGAIDSGAIDSGAIDSGAIDIVVVTMQFDAIDDAALLGVLSKYVVLARGEPGCRNVDLVASVTHERRHLVIEKWESPASQRRHFDSAMMVEMASGCAGLLSGPPQIDLWEATSVHDLR